MALDRVITDGDIVEFDTTCQAAILTLLMPEVTIQGSGKTTVQGKQVCIAGDESSVEVPCTYITSQHTKPGTGTLRIKEWVDHVAQKTSSGGEAMILQGSEFNSIFKVETAAQDIKPMASGNPAIDDTAPEYEGKGRLIAANQTIKAT